MVCRLCQWPLLFFVLACRRVGTAVAVESSEYPDDVTAAAVAATATAVAATSTVDVGAIGAVPLSKNEDPRNTSRGVHDKEAETARVESIDDATPTTNAKNDGGRTGVDELRGRLVRLTNELGVAKAALDIARQYERRLSVLERDKYW